MAMLRELHISNYAIINKIDIDFNDGLNIITGETGAGKSIIAGALGLVLGTRADTTVLLDKEKKCLVEAIFDTSDIQGVKSFLEGLEIEADDELIIRREISNNGKSRAFINDTPANLSQLQELSALLVDMHQQFDTLQLGQQDFQIDVLDALASQMEEKVLYKKLYIHFKHAQQKLEALVHRKQEALKEFDYYQFQYDELEEASFGDGEIEALEAEQAMLSNAENLTSILDKISHLLDNGEQPVIQLIKSLSQQVEAAGKWHASMIELAARLKSTQIELQDIAGEAERIAAGVSNDEKRRDEVSERLSLAYRLLKKHQVKTTEELLKVKHEIGGKLRNVISLDEEIQIAESTLKEFESSLLRSASVLSKGRNAVSKSLEKKVIELLKQVGMPNAIISISIAETSPGPSGKDHVEFLFDANKSGRFEPLRKVASGGELSRLLLCIKTLVAGSLEMPVMIFDEIDSGISGEAARQVGILMKEMAKSHQIISITHQPQIAAKANAHFYVYKKEMDGAVRTQLKKLNERERVESIAKMMSGEKLTESALQNAREMMEG